MLLNSGIGQGLFFAGNKHVAIQIIASYGEDKLVTTNPEEMLQASAQTAEYAGVGEETEPAEELPAEEAQAEEVPEEVVEAPSEDLGPASEGEPEQDEDINELPGI